MEANGIGSQNSLDEGNRLSIPGIGCQKFYSRCERMMEHTLIDVSGRIDWAKISIYQVKELFHLTLILSSFLAQFR